VQIEGIRADRHSDLDRAVALDVAPVIERRDARETE